jgi:thiamine pyrophosphate-dependent acetolactate synthase large subunit-like protein
MPITGQLSTLTRRRLLKGAAIGGAAVGVTGAGGARAARSATQFTKLKPPSAVQTVAEVESPGLESRLTTKKSGSDFMVDVVKAIDIDFVAAVPGSTFRGLQESFINYGGNAKPEWLTCMHEEASVAMAHGYAKAAGKPMAAMVQGTVGLQHATMAIYNAWCDRVPVLIFAGNNAAPVEVREPGVDWTHTAQDNGALVRDITKFDDYPWSPQSFAESTVRAYVVATTPPMAPVLVVADANLQEAPLRPEQEAKLHIPKVTTDIQPKGDDNAVREAARMLVSAENPVIIADRYARTPQGMRHLVELADFLQAPVIDTNARMNFPNRHPLNHSQRKAALIAQADVILGLEIVDFYGLLHNMRDQLDRVTFSIVKTDVKLISIGTHDFLLHSNYQDSQRYQPTDLPIAGDAEATVPALIEAITREINSSRRSELATRGEKLAKASEALVKSAREDATYGWDASPISSARMYMELWNQIKSDDWALVSTTYFSSNWPFRLWDFDRPYRHIGGSGGIGIGYQQAASTGAALAHREHGRLVVSVTGDGELNMSPGVLWTAVHHGIPLLTIVQNNRAYHQEWMHIQRMANRHNRGIDRTWIGTTISAPNVDYAKIAQGYGMFAVGPVSDPKALAAAFQKCLAVVRRGEPALIDVVMQPR